MRFFKLTFSQSIPDEKILWLFRECLKKANMIDDLFNQFEGYIQKQGYLARGGVLVDTSLVEVLRQLNNRWKTNVSKMAPIQP